MKRINERSGLPEDITEMYEKRDKLEEKIEYQEQKFKVKDEESDKKKYKRYRFRSRSESSDEEEDKNKDKDKENNLLLNNIPGVKQITFNPMDSKI